MDRRAIGINSGELGTLNNVALLLTKIQKGDLKSIFKEGGWGKRTN